MKLKTFLFFILVILIFLAINLTGASSQVKDFFFNVSSSFQKTMWGVGESVSDFLGSLFRGSYLEKRVSELELENQRLLVEVVSLGGLEKENASLREALRVGLEKDFELELSRVINKDIFQDSLLIDKGSEDGISEGFPVITSQKILLGRIGEIYGDFSEVVLITNKNSSFDAMIFEKDIYGVARGEGGLGLLLDLIPKEREVIEGDLVFTTALGGIFPEGLLVGQVKEVRKADVEAFQEAEISSSFDLGSIEEVFIIKDF